MADLKWREAIVKVFEEERKALHYTVIAELIAERGYRTSLGATPQDTVSANMTTDINTNGDNSIFAKVDKGVYILRKFLNDNSITPITDNNVDTTKKVIADRIKIINAFGIYWNRSKVH